MTIAIPTLDGQVSAHFGKTRDFTLFSISDDRQVTGTRTVINPVHDHNQLGDMLKQNGVDLVICGGMGQGARDKLAAVGILVLGGVTGVIHQVVSGYLDGSLQPTGTGQCNCGGHHNN